MNFRLTAIFFGLAVALVVVLLGIVLLDTTPRALTEGNLWGELTKQGVEQKDIDRIELARTTTAGDEKLVFTREGLNPWRLVEPYPAKVDDGLVNSVIVDLFTAKPIPYAELTSNLTLHGLDKPSYRVTFASKDKSATLNLGLSTLGTRPITFVTTSAAPKQPLATKRLDLSAIFRDSASKSDGEAWMLCKWLADFRVKKPLGSDLRDPVIEASSLSIAQGSQGFAMARGTSSTDPWTFTKPEGFGEVEEAGDSLAQALNAPFTGLRPLFNSLLSLQTVNPEDYIEKPEPLSNYGLDPSDPNLLRISLTVRGATETLLLGNPVVKDGQPTTPAKVYGKLEGDGGIMLLTYDRLEALKATVRNPNELRNKDLLPEGKRGTADAIDLMIGATTLKFRKINLPGEPNAAWLIYGGPKPVYAKTGEVEQLLSILSRPRNASEVLSGLQDEAFVDAEKKATIKVWYAGIPKDKLPQMEPGQLPAEPAVEGTPYELTIGRKDANLLFVRRLIDGAKVDLKVPEATLAVALKSRVEWIDPRFKSFVTTNVNRISFKRGNVLYDLEREAVPDIATNLTARSVWRFVQPEPLKGREANTELIDSVIGRLSSLFPERILSENPSDEELKKFGLEPSAARSTVTLGLKDEAMPQLTFRFGVDLAEGKSIAFLQDGLPFVAQLPRSLFDSIETGELRDRYAYRVPSDRVNKLKIRGWRNVVGGPTPLTYELTKGANGWQLDSPANVPIDPAKIRQLVALISQPPIEAFLGMPQPEHHVNIEQFPEVLEFTLSGDGFPAVALVVGNAAPGQTANAYATASTTPNEIFLLNVEELRKLTEKPLNLQK